MWTTVREKVRQRSRTTEVLLAGAIVRAVEDNTLILGHESAPLAKRLCEQRNADVIRDALKDALGVNWKVRCEVGVGQPAQEAERPLPPEPEPDPVDRQRAEEDSMIAEVGRDDDAAPRRDPEEVALELLQNELGARKIDG
jgi:DNA polymerase-3 subunit gamma/tau